jgi:purine-binding chemotaxis protein CheW
VLTHKADGMDWQELLAQLDRQDATRQERMLHSRLRERAQHYALPKETADHTQVDALHVVTLLLGDERCAIDVRAVRGVRAVDSITRVPSTPPFYRGVVNVRGQIISALDLTAFFDIGGAHLTPRELLVVEANELTLAILADRVEDVVLIPRADIEPVDMRYALGVTRDRITVLDIDQITADERLIVGGKHS